MYEYLSCPPGWELYFVHNELHKRRFKLQFLFTLFVVSVELFPCRECPYLFSPVSLNCLLLDLRLLMLILMLIPLMNIMYYYITTTERLLLKLNVVTTFGKILVLLTLNADWRCCHSNIYINASCNNPSNSGNNSTGDSDKCTRTWCMHSVRRSSTHVLAMLLLKPFEILKGTHD